MDKYCTRCQQHKDINEFGNHKKTKDGLRGWCKDCCKKSSDAWKNKNITRRQTVAARSRLKLKKKIMTAYGHKCYCCGESELAFLTIDHIDNNGADHKRSFSSGGMLYKWLENNNYPEGFRVSCWNCNSGRAINNNICPHEITKKKIWEIMDQPIGDPIIYSEIHL